jgi:hypothetical protein
MSFFEDRASMLAYYGNQASEFRMRHDAIFSEIKHYSWLISTLLASPIALLLGKERLIVTIVLPYLLAFPVLGSAFSVLAFFIIRREFHFYNERRGPTFVPGATAWGYIEPRIPRWTAR